MVMVLMYLVYYVGVGFNLIDICLIIAQNLLFTLICSFLNLLFIYCFFCNETAHKFTSCFGCRASFRDMLRPI